MVFNALGVVMVTNLLTRSPTGVITRVQVVLAFVVVLVEMVLWRLDLLRWPMVPVMLYSVWSYGYAARAFMRYSGEARNAFLRWRFRSLGWGFVMACVYAFGRTWQTHLFPPEFRVVLGVVNRSTLVIAAILICLGFLMPRWYAFTGTRLEVLWHATRYYDHLIGFLGLLHDQRWGVTNQQRIALAYWAEKVALEVKAPPGFLAILRTTAQVAPIQFVRYNGRDINHEAFIGESDTFDDPLESIDHFSRVYQVGQGSRPSRTTARGPP